MVIGGWIAQQAVELALRRHPSFRYQVQVGWTVMILSQLGGRVRYVKSVRGRSPCSDARLTVAQATSNHPECAHLLSKRDHLVKRDLELEERDNELAKRAGGRFYMCVRSASFRFSPS